MGTNTAPTAGSYTDNGDGTYKLAVPAATTIVDASSGFTITLNINGTLNGTATLPVVDLNGVAAGNDSAYSFAAGGPAAKIAPAGTITRATAANLTSMTVTLVAPPDGVNESLAGDVSGTGLTLAPYDSGSGQLTITGSGTLAQYQSVLQKITYSDSLGNPTVGTRTVTVAVTDAGNTSITRTAAGTVSAPAAAKITSVKIGDGTSQRSRVSSVALTFDSKVTLPGTPASAFTLLRFDNSVVNLTGAVDNSGPTSVVTLTFTGGAVNGDSLADGRYTLTGLAGQINGGAFDGDGNGIAGDNYVLASAAAPSAPTNLWRLFGDSDGDNDVDATDFGLFRAAFGGPGGSIFNSDGDGDVDAVDFGAFRQNFGAAV